MTPRFSDRERSAIRERLLDSGFKRFTSAGLQKTSVEEICRDAGIAKGSFYSFFNCKEELFIAVETRFARTKTEAAVMQAVATGEAGREGLRTFILNAAKAMADGTGEGHQVFRQEDADRAMRKLPHEVVMRYVNEGEHWLTPAARIWQQHGMGDGTDPEVVAELVAAVIFAPLGPGVQRGPRFDAALEIMADAVVQRLCPGE